MGMKELVDDIKKGLAMTTTKNEPRLIPKNLLSTGSTLVNLACTGKPNGGFLRGCYYLFVGDSTSGKTWLALSCLAEACQNKRFKDYNLIYDNNEDGAMMDMAKFFGKGVADRLQPPMYDADDAGVSVFSQTIDDFYFNAHDCLEAGPCIYILDSMDSLSSEVEQKKFDERKKASRKGQLDKVKGDYGDAKAKKNSSGIRQLLNAIRRYESILIIICQTRDNIDSFSFEKKTRSGGRALRFYATLELWTSVKKKLHKTVRDKERQVGIMARVQIKKNRATGKEWAVDIPLYHSYGIDDIGCCVDFLVSEKHWPKQKAGGRIKADEFNFEGTRTNLISHVEGNNKEKVLRTLVGKVWSEIEEACTLQRKPRYE